MVIFGANNLFAKYHKIETPFLQNKKTCLTCNSMGGLR